MASDCTSETKICSWATDTSEECYLAPELLMNIGSYLPLNSILSLSRAEGLNKNNTSLDGAAKAAYIIRLLAEDLNRACPGLVVDLDALKRLCSRNILQHVRELPPSYEPMEHLPIGLLLSDVKKIAALMRSEEPQTEEQEAKLLGLWADLRTQGFHDTARSLHQKYPNIVPAADFPELLSESLLQGHLEYVDFLIHHPHFAQINARGFDAIFFNISLMHDNSQSKRDSVAHFISALSTQHQQNPNLIVISTLPKVLFTALQQGHLEYTDFLVHHPHFAQIPANDLEKVLLKLLDLQKKPSPTQQASILCFMSVLSTYPHLNNITSFYIHTIVCTHAAKYGLMPLLNAVIQHPTFNNINSIFFEDALRAAISNNQVDCALTLIAHPYFRMIPDLDDLLEKSVYCDLSVLQALLHHRDKITERTLIEILQRFANAGHIEHAHTLLNHPDSLKKISGSHLIQIIFKEFAKQGHHELMQTVLTHPIYCEKIDDFTQGEALSLAAEYNHLNCIKLLLERPYSYDELSDYSLTTALRHAIRYNHVACVQTLLSSPRYKDMPIFNLYHVLRTASHTGPGKVLLQEFIDKREPQLSIWDSFFYK